MLHILQPAFRETALNHFLFTGPLPLQVQPLLLSMLPDWQIALRPPLGAWVYTDSLVIKNTTGIVTKLAKDFNFSVYPNPISDNLNVKFTLNGASSVNMDMIDITGRKVADFISGNEMNGEINNTFDVSYLTKGIYFIRLKVNDELTVKKIVIE